MGRDLDEHRAAFLKHGETSQSLSLSDIFTLKDGYVTPVLKVTCNNNLGFVSHICLGSN